MSGAQRSTNCSPTLFINLRLFIRAKDRKRAGETAARLAQCREVSIANYLRFIGRVLLEDKFPEGARYFDALTYAFTTLDPLVRVQTFVAFAIALSRLETCSKPFQLAFVSLQTRLSNWAEDAVLYQAPEDRFEIPTRVQKLDLGHGKLKTLKWSQDYVLRRAWYVLLKDKEQRCTQMVLPQIHGAAYRPIKDHDLAHQSKKRLNISGDTLYKNEVKSFMQHMDEYINENSDLHYGDVTPLLVTLRRKARLAESVPKDIDGVDTVLQKSLRTGWWVDCALPEATQWVVSHPKIESRDNLRKIQTFYRAKRNNERFGVRSTHLRAVKWRKQVYFLEERLEEGKPLTIKRLEEQPSLCFGIMKILVYRHAAMLRTRRENIVIYDGGVVSTGETVKKDYIRHPNVWKKLFNSPQKKSVAFLVEQLKDFLRQHGETLFKPYMEERKMQPLYDDLMGSINT
jgi:hypothetical protein